MIFLKFFIILPIISIFLCSCKDSHKEEFFHPIVNDTEKLLSPKNKNKLQSIASPKGVQIIVETVSRFGKGISPHKFADSRFDFYDDKYTDTTGFDKRGILVLICNNPTLVQIRLGSEYKNRNAVYGYAAGEKYYDIQKNTKKSGLTETAISLAKLNIEGINEKESSEQDFFTNSCYYISDGISFIATSVNYLLPTAESWQTKLFHCITIPTGFLSKFTNSWTLAISIVGLFFSSLFYIVYYKLTLNRNSGFLFGLFLFQFIIFAYALYIIWGCLFLYAFPKMETDNIRVILGIPLLMDYPVDMHLLEDLNPWFFIFPFILIIIYISRYLQPISCGMFLENTTQNRIATNLWGNLWNHYQTIYPEDYSVIGMGDTRANTTKEKVEEEIRKDGYFSLIASTSFSTCPLYLQGIMLILLFFPNPFIALIVIFYLPKFILKLALLIKHHKIFNELNYNIYKEKREASAWKSILARSYGTKKQGVLARTYASTPSAPGTHQTVMDHSYPCLPYILMMCVLLPSLCWVIFTEGFFAFFLFKAPVLIQWIKGMF